MKLERADRAPRKNHYKDRASELVAHEAAAFILQEAGPGSLITVTHAIPVNRGERMSVFISVFPEERGLAALALLERKREEFSEHLKKHTRLRPLPRVNFMIDDGSSSKAPLPKPDISNKPY